MSGICNASWTQNLQFGKRLPNSTYVATSSLRALPNVCSHVASRASTIAGIDPEQYQVIKWQNDGSRITFLAYPALLKEAHPALRKSVSVNLLTAETQVTEYSHHSDVPILHRCEELLEPAHPLRSTLEQLTKAESRFGLFNDTSRIGMRNYWASLLQNKGLRIDGFSIAPIDAAFHPIGHAVEYWPTERQRTAIQRSKLSVPPQLLLDCGLLRERDTYFDYGCGHGKDLGILNQMGIQATGWDPAHAPNTPRTEADIVNLGYVLNVVESEIERAAILKDAWHLSRRALCVSVRIRAEDTSIPGSPFADGILTRIGTFQKYFEASEFFSFCERNVGSPLVNLAPGIIVICRDEATTHGALLSQRRTPKSRHPLQTQTSAAPPPVSVSQHISTGPSRRRSEARDEYLRKCIPLLDEFIRPPSPLEIQLPTDTHELGLHAREIWKWYVSKLPKDELPKRIEQRRRDILVKLARVILQGRLSADSVCGSLSADIKALFPSTKHAQSEALLLLRAAGDSSRVSQLCAETDFGIHTEQALCLHASAIPYLHPTIRCYIACGELLAGEATDDVVIKVHKATRKISFLRYQGLFDLRLPGLIERIKVDLRSRKVFVYDHRAQPRQLLYDLDLLLHPSHRYYQTAQSHSQDLVKVIGPIHGLGPSHIELRDVLRIKSVECDPWVVEDFAAPEVDDFDQPDISEKTKPEIAIEA